MKSFTELFEELKSIYKKGDTVHFHDDLKKIQMGQISSVKNTKGEVSYVIDRHGVKFNRKQSEVYSDEKSINESEDAPNKTSRNVIAWMKKEQPKAHIEGIKTEKYDITIKFAMPPEGFFLSPKNMESIKDLIGSKLKYVNVSSKFITFVVSIS